MESSREKPVMIIEILSYAEKLQSANESSVCRSRRMTVTLPSFKTEV